MLKKIIIIFLIIVPLFSCSSFTELNEKVKGDGVPYLPGI